MLLAKNHPLGRLGLAWQLSEYHGWGVFGLNVARTLVAQGYQPAKLLNPPNIDFNKYPELASTKTEWLQNEAAFAALTAKLHHPGVTVIHSLGNDFVFTNKQHWGDRNIGFIFFETTLFSSEGLARANTLDLILTGSRWNAQILSKMGLKNVAYVMQGVDLTRFDNAQPKSNSGPFVIYSGGKLEFRKGQDIVLEAFKVFHQKRPDSLLLTSWHNPWPRITQDLISSPYGFGAPTITNEQVDIAEWCARSGLPSSAFKHIGPTPNEHMAQVYRQADIGLFPNRAEGGTNLVAMEVMAAGVPCILSENTGHLDLITGTNCYSLKQQTRYSNASHQGWGQSSIEEIVATLEHAYQHRDERIAIGKQGRAFIEQFTWANQTRQLIELCSNIY
jgi:glycosyltransferase involved in cell wall biosynthesis